MPDDPATRVAATLKRLEHVDVGIVVVSRPDAGRLAAAARARDVAIAAGRGQLLKEATAAARDLAIRAFARRGFTGTWAVADWSISTSGARDRVAVAMAFEEAATAAVVEDLLDDETAGTLRATSEELAMMTGTPEPGALSQAARSPVGALALAIYIVTISGIGIAVGSPVGFGVAIVGIALAAVVLSVRRSRRAN